MYTVFDWVRGYLRVNGSDSLHSLIKQSITNNMNFMPSKVFRICIKWSNYQTLL